MRLNKSCVICCILIVSMLLSGCSFMERKSPDTAVALINASYDRMKKVENISKYTTELKFVMHRKDDSNTKVDETHDVLLSLSDKGLLSDYQDFHSTLSVSMTDTNIEDDKKLNDDDKKNEIVASVEYYVTKDNVVYTRDALNDIKVWDRVENADSSNFFYALSHIGHQSVGLDSYEDASFERDKDTYFVSIPFGKWINNPSNGLKPLYNKLFISKDTRFSFVTDDFVSDLESCDLVYTFSAVTNELMTVGLDTSVFDQSQDSDTQESITYDLYFATKITENTENKGLSDIIAPNEIYKNSMVTDHSSVLSSIWDGDALSKMRSTMDPELSEDEMVETGDVRSCHFFYNDMDCSFPFRLKNLIKDGWELEQDGIIEAKSSSPVVDLVNEKYGNVVFSVVIDNPTGGRIAYKDGNIIDLSVVSEDASLLPMSFPGGIHFGSTKKDVDMKYGVPEYDLNMGDNERYRYDLPNGKCYVELYFTMDGILYGIRYRVPEKW